MPAPAAVAKWFGIGNAADVARRKVRLTLRLQPGGTFDIGGNFALFLGIAAGEMHLWRVSGGGESVAYATSLCAPGASEAQLLAAQAGARIVLQAACAHTTRVRCLGRCGAQCGVRGPVAEVALSANSSCEAACPHVRPVWGAGSIGAEEKLVLTGSGDFTHWGGARRTQMTSAAAGHRSGAVRTLNGIVAAHTSVGTLTRGGSVNASEPAPRTSRTLVSLGGDEPGGGAWGMGFGPDQTGMVHEGFVARVQLVRLAGKHDVGVMVQRVPPPPPPAPAPAACPEAHSIA